MVVSPEDAAVDVPPIVVFSWNVIAEADVYQLQVATDVAFTNLVFNDSTLTQGSVSVGPLAHETVHYWRVRGINAAGPGEWSEPKSFVTIMASPSAPPLVSPEHEAVEVPSSVEFSWETTASTERYQLQVATDAAFAHLVFNDSTITQTSHSFGPLAYETAHYWRVRGINAAGPGEWSDAWMFTVAIGTSTEHLEEIPESFALYANYPNPFNPTTTIPFDLPASSEVTLIIYDLLGREVVTLVSGTLPPGRYRSTWEGAGVPEWYLSLPVEGRATPCYQAVVTA